MIWLHHSLGKINGTITSSLRVKMIKTIIIHKNCSKISPYMKRGISLLKKHLWIHFKSKNHLKISTKAVLLTIKTTKCLVIACLTFKLMTKWHQMFSKALFKMFRKLFVGMINRKLWRRHFEVIGLCIFGIFLVVFKMRN